MQVQVCHTITDGCSCDQPSLSPPQWSNFKADLHRDKSAYCTMALVPVQRKVPISRSPVSYFQPQWQLGQWNSFFTPQQMMPMVPPPPMPTMEQAMQEMNRQMVQMQEQMNRSMAQFQRLFPVMPNMPPVPMHNDMQNSYVTEPDGSQRFRLTFDVRSFKPEELEIRTDDQMLSIYASHREQGPNSGFTREYRRSFLLPPNVRPEALQSVLSPEGVLTIEGAVQRALPAPPGSSSNISVPITRPVNPPNPGATRIAIA